MTHNSADVVVIGSGPAGSATALFLARKGYDVALLDRAAFPRSKPCGEYLTPGAVRLLRDECGVLPELLAQGAVSLTHETVTTHGGVTFGGQTDALACPRSVTDVALQNAARAAGVRVSENFSVRQILWNGNTIVGVSGTDEDSQPAVWNARVTVGADGTHSLLARALGVVRPLPRLQKIALVGHFLAPPPSGRASARLGAGGASAVAMHLPLDNTDACCGVGPPCGVNGARNVNMVVPQGEAKHMAGRRDEYFHHTLQASFTDVWEWVRDAQQVGDLQSVGCFGHTTTRATHNGAVLVGDAATFVHPFTGEGVFFALEGARLAAQTIDRALAHGEDLRAYDAARKRELSPRYKLCGLVQRVTHSPAWLAWAANRLRRSPDLTDVLLQTIGDAARPADLFSLRTARLLFSR